MSQVSSTGRAWTAHSEGCSLTAYEDPLGSDKYSIGYGHHGVLQGTTWTQQQAEDALDDDLAHACDVIDSLVKVTLTEGQVDALADFIFNIGEGQFQESTLLRVLNLAQYAQVPSELMRWKYASGEVNQGLIARREGEVALWNDGSPFNN